MTILIIAAHPDDEILGCGGTVARLIQDGEEAYSVILGEGITSRSDTRDSVTEKQVRHLEKQSTLAAEVIGIKKTICHRLPDNRFDTVPLLEIVKIIEKAVKKIGADIIFTHHGGDLNIDHTLTFRAVLTATRPISPGGVREIYSYEIPSSTEWSFQALDPSWKPNAFFGISATLDTKIRALKYYSAEMRTFPYPRSEKFVRDMAYRWGSITGTKAAEAFQIVRLIK